ncbi:MAG: hypothetical protein IKQ37_08135 [Bacteroidaceae bacterium]|nr:hypothetical protein [Bacteroidaceae bacterium]
MNWRIASSKLFALPLFAQSDWEEQIPRYAEQYAKCEKAPQRLQLANDFFAYLLKTEYLDEPIAFAADPRSQRASRLSASAPTPSTSATSPLCTSPGR